MRSVPALFAIVVLNISLMISCKKEADIIDNNNTNNNTDTNNNPPPAAVDSNDIFKWYLIDSSAASQDTTDMIVFSYDAQNRVTSITNFSNATAGTVPSNITEYYYNGSDNLPYRSYSGSANSRDTTDTFFFYDASGKRIKDSVINTYSQGSSYYTIRKTISLYNYSPSQIIGFSTTNSTTYSSSGISNSIAITMDTATLDADGNYIYSVKNYDGQTRYLTIITYNNSLNAFARLNIRNNFMVFPDESFNCATKHNPVLITQTQITSTSTTTKNWNLSYTYNSRGLTGEILVDNPDFSPGHYDKNVFVYQP